MHGTIRTVRPDSKGRITLGNLAEGVSSFSITLDSHNRIILEPFVEIPAHERWLFTRSDIRKQIEQGLKEAAKGKTKSRGSFAKYRDEDINE